MNAMCVVYILYSRASVTVLELVQPLRAMGRRCILIRLFNLFLPPDYIHGRPCFLFVRMLRSESDKCKDLAKNHLYTLGTGDRIICTLLVPLTFLKFVIGLVDKSV
jgi:hypothetical protein